jgi:hypothetical protein
MCAQQLLYSHKYERLRWRTQRLRAQGLRAQARLLRAKGSLIFDARNLTKGQPPTLLPRRAP